MEYVVFTIVLAAGGGIITWAWNRFMVVEKSNGAGSARQFKEADPIPPFKRTISGPRQDELDRAEFENRLWSWQRKLYDQSNRDPASVEGLSGTKYTYVPRQRQSAGQPDTGM